MLPDRVSNPGPLTYKSGVLNEAVIYDAHLDVVHLVCLPLKIDQKVLLFSFKGINSLMSNSSARANTVSKNTVRLCLERVVLFQ